ncbi:apoptosis-inducing factor 3-like isoform X3 [Rhineura floridana]|uniref:apoptosis-inducing factor 3-like isoform X3 n=1 Tax=Rhineura floridana TaxID=261503 RepID=UPI002AC81BCB|nr:apoptosis-inducing factor 3-like isoform X3 [Rhineura floridana]
MEGEDRVITQEVCREDEMYDGEMREVQVAGHPVLLVRDHLQFRGLGSKCPHAGAPLAKGYLGRGRIRCPFHGACFSLTMGDIEEYPTLDCLAAFKVTVESGQVYVTAKVKDLESGRRVKHMSKWSQLSSQTVLLLGAGPAALTCAETLRQEGFTGRVIMVTRENHQPYDRTKLSKEMDAKAESIYLRPQSFLDAHNIEVWMQKEVVSLDLDGKRAQFSDGTCQGYDHLLIATGSRPRRLQCPGSNLQNICVLLTPEDASQILHLATGKRVAIVGASFIGMEVAASLVGKAACIQVVEKADSPYQAVLGDQVGRVAMKMLQAQGVTFHMKAEVAEVQGERGKVTQVILDNGQKIPADVVVVGIVHADQHPFCLCCWGRGLLSCGSARWEEHKHLSLADCPSPRPCGCPQHPAETGEAAYGAFLLDQVAKEEHPVCRMRDWLHRDRAQRGSGPGEVPPLLH